MDHYQVLGVHRQATKEEIKESFRKLALQYHPDRHSQSSQSVRDSATSRFQKISEAYDTLMDDRKRAEYNIRSSSPNRRSGTSNQGFRQHYYDHSRGSEGFRPRSSSFTTFLEVAAGYFTTRTFLLNLAFAGVLCGGIVAIDRGRGALWNINNSGKSFEDAMDALDKAKSKR